LQNKEVIESNQRISKCNYGSRTNYSIENAILEKQLVHNCSMLSGNITIHNMTDLKLYYDRQLPQMGSIIKESIGIERKPIKLIAKLLPVMKHHICIAHGASEKYYGRKQDKVAGTGQGYIVSGNICRDSSGFTIKQIENQNLGVEIIDLITKYIEQQVSTAFIDDTNFMSDRNDADIKMHKILEIYTKLYQATGGVVEIEKISYFCWRWKRQKRKFSI